MTTEVLGARVKRVEDARFITGSGRYLDDIQLPGMTHMAILRSPYAHANIRSIDVSAAKAMPGVIAVFTGADIPYNPLPMAWPAGGASGLQNNVNMPSVLAEIAGEDKAPCRSGSSNRYGVTRSVAGKATGIHRAGLVDFQYAVGGQRSRGAQRDHRNGEQH